MKSSVQERNAVGKAEAGEGGSGEGSGEHGSSVERWQEPDGGEESKTSAGTWKSVN